MKKPWPPFALPAWRLYRRLSRNPEEALSWTLAGLLFLYIAANSPAALERFLSSGPARREIRQAKASALTYERVRQDPAAARGQLVYWRILYNGSSYYYNENMGMPVTWEGAPPPAEVVGVSWRAHGATLLAEVRDVRPNEIVLAYRGTD